MKALRFSPGKAAAAAFFVFSATCAAQEAVKPGVKVDDRWVYKRTDRRMKPPSLVYEVRATFVDARAIHTLLERQGGQRESDAVWTPEWNSVVAVDGGVVELEKGLLQFPLRPGQRYPAAWDVRRPTFGAFHVRHEREVRVEGWEEIEVPAGRFRALKVHAEGRYQRIDKPVVAKASNTIWYVPRVKRWVKNVYQDAELEIVEELYFYKVQ